MNYCNMKVAAILTSLITLTTGCTGMGSIARALAKDPAFVTVQVRTLYGSGFIVRDGRPGNGNVVTPEGAVQSIFPQTQSTNPPAIVNITNVLNTNRLGTVVEPTKAKAE